MIEILFHLSVLIFHLSEMSRWMGLFSSEHSSYLCLHSESDFWLWQVYQLSVKATVKQNRSYPCNRLWRPIGLWGVNDPTSCRLLFHRWRPGCQPNTLAALYPQKHYFSASGTHFCYRLSKPQGLVWPEGLGKLKGGGELVALCLNHYAITPYRAEQVKLYDYYQITRCKIILCLI
jgi:hypothetical protein